MLQNFYNSFELTQKVDFAMGFILVVSAFFYFLVVGLMIYFVFRYDKSRNEKASNIHGNIPLEVVWTVIPTILVMFFFYYGYDGFITGRTVPDDAMEVNVNAMMWQFSYEYDNGEIMSDLYVPVGKPVKLNIRSQDVIHSHYIPAFRLKTDAIPGMTTYQWFRADEEGEYDVLCAEYCGLRHAYMINKIKAVPEEEFNAVIYGGEPPVLAAAEGEGMQAQALSAPAKRTVDPVKAGERVYKINCASCHSIDGSRIVGPSFKGLYGKPHNVERDGSTYEVIADEEYLTRSIKQPNYEIVEGYPAAMGKQNVSEEDIKNVISYMKTLSE